MSRSGSSADWRMKPVAPSTIEALSGITFALFINLLSALDFSLLYLASVLAALGGAVAVLVCIHYKTKAEDSLKVLLAQDEGSDDKQDELARAIQLRNRAYMPWRPSILRALYAAVACLTISTVLLVCAKRATARATEVQHEVLMHKIESIEKKLQSGEK